MYVFKRNPYLGYTINYLAENLARKLKTEICITFTSKQSFIVSSTKLF